MPAAFIASLLPEWSTMANAHTGDITDDDLTELASVASDLEASPYDLAGCWMSESELRTHAHNPGGDAAGIFQAMPATLRGLGFKGDWRAFTALSFREQLQWARKYYAPHRGRLTSAGACYLATYLPALMAHATEPNFVLCSSTMNYAWYAPNRFAFDPYGRGYITVRDLTDRIARVTTGHPRWDEFEARLRAIVQGADTSPEVVYTLDEEFPANDEGEEPT